MPFDTHHLKKIKSGVECFNNQEYWECHEELEHVWIEDRQDPVRNVYWAIIQVAAALVHYRNQNIIGAQGLINKAREKFQRCRDLHVLSDLTEKFLDWNEFEKLSLKVPVSDAKLEDFKDLFDWRFKNYKSEIE